MWCKSKQVERAACDRLLADMGTVLQYGDELAEIGPVLTKLASQEDGVVMPSVQHFALQQQMASLTATVTDHETAILELERQVASLETGVQSLDTKAGEVGELLSESLSVVEDRFKVMDEDFKELLERRTVETTSVVQEQMVQVERFTASVHQSATVFRESLSKLENRVHKVTVRVSALDKRQLVVEEMEKRLRDTEPFVAVVAQLETRVEKMEQLEVQYLNLWGLANLTEVMVAELRTKFESRVTNLEQWGDNIAESLNAVQCRVEILEHRW